AQFKDCAGGFRFEPHVAERIFHDMLQEAKVPTLFGQRLANVMTERGIISSITMHSGLAVDAKVLIDASYEGDLMAKAEVTYTVGREGREQYNVSIAGVQKHSVAHQWPVKLSPFAQGKKLLPFIQSQPAGAPGSGDRKVQAYNFRLCMTK